MGAPSSARAGAGAATRRRSAPELRNPERELYLFRRRLVARGRSSCSRCSGPRRALLLPAGDRARTLPNARRDEPDRDRSDRSRTAASSRDRNGIVLAQSYSAYTLEIQPSRVKNLEETIDALAEIVDIQPRDRKRFQQAPRRIEEFREPAAAHPADRRRSRALRGEPLPVSRRRDQGAAVPPVSATVKWRRMWSATSGASTIATSRASRNGTRPRTTRAPTTSARSASSSRTSASCTERRASRRSRSTPAGARCARCRACRRHRATISCSRSTSSCRRSRKPRSATRRGALVALDPTNGEILALVSKPGYDPNLFVDGIDSANWELLNDSPDKPLLNRPLRGAYPPGSDDQAVPRARSAHVRKRTHDAGDLRSRLLPASGRGAPLQRRQAGRTRQRRHVQVDRRLLRHVLLRSRERDRYRRHVPVSDAIRIRPQDRHRRRRRASRRAAVARLEAPALRRRRITAKSTGSGISATASPPASGRATTRSRRFSSRMRSRRLRATASSYQPHLVKSIRSIGTGAVREIAIQPTNTVTLKPEHLAFIKKALAGVNLEGTSAAAFAKAPYVSARQDRHRAGRIR